VPVRDFVYWSKVSVTSKSPRWRREISYAYVTFDLSEGSGSLHVTACDWAHSDSSGYFLLLARPRVLKATPIELVVEAMAWSAKVGGTKIKFTPVRVTCIEPRTREVPTY
jgi:hypothetical protein